MTTTNKTVISNPLATSFAINSLIVDGLFLSKIKDQNKAKITAIEIPIIYVE